MEVRRQAVMLHGDGLGAKRIGKALGIDSSVIKGWIQRYKKYGEEALQPWWRERARLETDAVKTPPQPEQGSLWPEYRQSETAEPICGLTGQSMTSVSRSRGAHRACTEKYAEAIERIRTTSESISRVAAQYNLSACGLRHHLQTYHKDIAAQLKIRREQAAKNKSRRYVNRGIHRPKPETEEYYREAVELYRTTDMTLEAIAERTGIKVHNLRFHIRYWHRELMLQRMGVMTESLDSNAEEIRTGTNKYWRSIQYADAVARLNAGGVTISAVATEFGLKYDTFRRYLMVNEPQLAMRLREEPVSSSTDRRRQRCR